MGCGSSSQSVPVGGGSSSPPVGVISPYAPGSTPGGDPSPTGAEVNEANRATQPGTIQQRNSQNKEQSHPSSPTNGQGGGGLTIAVPSSNSSPITVQHELANDRVSPNHSQQEKPDLLLPRKSVNSKRLTLPTLTAPPSSSGVGTTALNLALASESCGSSDRSGSGSARGGGVTPPGSARRRKEEEKDGEILVSIPFFEALDPKAIRKLRSAFQRLRYSAGEWITRSSKKSVDPTPSDQPSPGDFFVIISGQVQLSVRIPTSKTTAAAAATIVKTPTHRADPTTLPETEYEDLTLAVLNSGQWCGSEALSGDSFQKADILALTDCVLLSISREAFHTFAADIPSMHTSIADVVTNTRVSLRSLPFFAEVDELKLQQLSQLLEFRRFKKGQVIVREGELSDGFYVVVSGSASVSVHTRENATFLLSSLQDGDYFGETSLLNPPKDSGLNTPEFKPAPRVATVTAASDMLLLFLSSIRFTRFGRLAPEVFSDAFNKISSQRTTQLLKTIPLFDVLCLEKSQEESFGEEANSEVEKVVDATSKNVYDENKLSLLASLFQYESFQSPGTIIFHEGDRADKLYIIVRGSVQVSAKVETGTVVLNTLKQSMFFGEISMLHATLRSATITTLEPCLCLTLTADKFARFLSIAPELRDKLSFAIGPRVASIIENIPFFRNEIKENKPWSKLGLLGELCQFQKAEENEVLFKQGDLADKFFVIVTGAVLVTKSDCSIPEDGCPTVEIERRASGGPIIKESTHTNGTNDAQSRQPHRSSTIVPGVILRRGNYFGTEVLEASAAGSNATRWGTVTSLALSVFLTLSRENFERYIKIAPELRALIANRQQSHYGGTANGATAVARVAANQSLETSPIFSHDDDKDDEFTPSKKVQQQHPHLGRLATAPQKVRHLAFKELSSPTSASSSLLHTSPLDRPSAGRLPSLPKLAGSPTHLTKQPSLGLAPLPTLPEKRASQVSKELQEAEEHNTPQS